MKASFLELAEALRETDMIGRQVLARLSDELPPEQLADMRRRKDRVSAAADLITGLASQETMVRALIRVGGLGDFPTFSPDTARVETGSVVLVRAIATEIYPTEAMVRITLAAERLSTAVLIGRADIVGIERRSPLTGL